MLKQSIGVTTALLTGLLALPTGVDAQERGNWSLDGAGGFAVPTGDIGDLKDTGGNLALGLGYEVHPRVDLRFNFSADFPSADEEREITEPDEVVPDFSIMHYTGGIEVQLTPPADSRWELTANAGAGVATFDSDPFRAGPLEDQEFEESYFTTKGGVKLGYQVTPMLDIFTRAEGHVVFTDEEDTQAFADVSPDLAAGFDTAVTFPIQLGARLTF